MCRIHYSAERYRNIRGRSEIRQFIYYSPFTSHYATPSLSVFAPAPCMQAMEVDEKPTEEYSDIGGCDAQIQVSAGRPCLISFANCARVIVWRPSVHPRPSHTGVS